MAISVNNVQNRTVVPSGTTDTLASYVVSGAVSDRCLVVIISGECAGLPLTGITFGGVALTLANNVNEANGNGVEIWYLVNPSASTADLVATLDQSVAGNSFKWSAFVLGGVDQSSPLGAIADYTGSTTGSAPAASLTSTVADGIIVGGASNGGTNDAMGEPGAPQVRLLLAGGSSSSDAHAYKPTTTIGTYGLSWTTVFGLRVCACIAEFVPAAGGGSTETGAGSSAGVATAAAVGRSTARAAGSAAGVGAASGVGRSTARTAGSAAGVAAGAAVGASAARAAGSAAGAATAAAVGRSTARAVGTAAGVATAAAVADDGTTETAVGSAAGAATAAAVGRSTARAAGTAAGLAAAAAVGRAHAYAAGSAAGIGAAAATGRSTARAAGTAAGAATAAAVGRDASVPPVERLAVVGRDRAAFAVTGRDRKAFTATGGDRPVEA